jgi:hypothetical protein
MVARWRASHWVIRLVLAVLALWLVVDVLLFVLGLPGTS